MNNFKVLLVLFAFSMLVSCTKEEADVTSITPGWKVSFYKEYGEDKTAVFSDYIFEFKDGNVFSATKGSHVVTGFWKEVVDSGRNIFVLNIDNKIPYFGAISEDWIVRSKSDTSIKLISNDGNASTVGNDVLEFSK